MKSTSCLIFFLGGLVALACSSASTNGFAGDNNEIPAEPLSTTDWYPYPTVNTMTMTFADRVNSLLNAKTLIPNHPEEDEVSQEQEEDEQEQATNEMGLSKIISKLKRFLQNDQNLNEVYSNYLTQFCGDRVLPQVDSEMSPIDDVSYRRAIFKENLLQVAEHNALARDGKISYEKGINKFSDMAVEDILNSYTGAIMSPSSKKSDRTANSSVISKLPTLTELEVDLGKGHGIGIEFNWATHGYVTPIRDQGQCGSCVFFATVAAVESAYLISQGYELDLSEQELLDCMKGMEGYYGCRGNLPHVGFQYMEDYGLSFEEDYMYVAHTKNDCSAQELDRTAPLGYWEEVDNMDEDEDILKRLVRRQGPIAVGIAVQRDFTEYHQGVYESHRCSKIHNHMVLVVGYGTTGNGKDYWVVKNSWGESWGDEGYIRVRRNYGNLCGIATHPFYVGVE